MANAHPSYDRPTIQEAICEIRFRLPDGIAWNQLWFSDFFKHVQDQFPRFEPVTPPSNFQLVVGSLIQQTASPHIVRYHHRERQLLIQLSQDRIVVNILPEYPGWNQMSKDINYAWGKVSEIVEPALVSRLALRYINRIEKSAPNQPLGYWLKSNNYIPPAILDSLPVFSANVSARLSDTDRLNVGVTDQLMPSIGHGAFLFDIDRIKEGETSADMSIVEGEIFRLHENVWEVFNSAKGDNLEDLLKGEIR